MKKVMIFSMCFIILFSSFSISVQAESNYRYQYSSLLTAAGKSYDEFIDVVNELRTEHPLIMPDEWAEKFISLAEEGKKAPEPSWNSEYDIFDNITYCWFGEARKANADDNCVVVQNKSGSVLSFMLPTESPYYIKKFTAIINGDKRITKDVKNSEFDYVDTSYYAFLDIDYSFLNDKSFGTLESVAFRFYGKSDRDTVDYFLTDEEIDQLNELFMCANASVVGKIKDACNEWNDTMKSVVDYSIPPAQFVIFLKNNYPIFPSQTTTEDLNKVENANSRIFEKICKDGQYTPGKVYFLPCVIEDITAPSERTPQTAWVVSIKGQYNNMPNYPVSARIIIDHALEMGWITEEPSIGDEIIVIATYCGRGSVSWKEIFYLGNDQYTLDIANSFSG